MLRVGGTVVATEDAAQFSSAAKGETLEDTIRVVNSYCDLIVLRHFKSGASEIAARYSKVPVINAGDGNGEHPTQSLLDLYTIFSKFPNPNFTICLMGDLANGRTIHSLSYLLSHYPKVKLVFVSPKELVIPDSLRKYLKQNKMSFEETEEMEKSLKNADIIYQTRIQKERFKSEKKYKKYFGNYIIDKNTLNIIKKNAIIMHPLPRINEISASVDEDKRAIYFEQSQNGLYIRMALLLYLFDKQ